MSRREDGGTQFANFMVKLISSTIGILILLLWLAWKRRQGKSFEQISEMGTALGIFAIMMCILFGLGFLAEGSPEAAPFAWVLFISAYILSLLTLSGDLRLSASWLDGQPYRQTDLAESLSSILEIQVPKSQVWQTEAIQQFIDALLMNFSQVIFVIDANQDAVH